MRAPAALKRADSPRAGIAARYELKRDRAHDSLSMRAELCGARLPNCRLLMAVLPRYHPVVTHFLPQPWRPTGERSKAQQGAVPVIATGNTHPGETAQGRPLKRFPAVAGESFPHVTNSGLTTPGCQK